MDMADSLDLGCPCEDGLPDPCTACGEGTANGICKLDLINAQRRSTAYAHGYQNGLLAAREVLAEAELNFMHPEFGTFWSDVFHHDDQGNPAPGPTDANLEKVLKEYHRAISEALGRLR